MPSVDNKRPLKVFLCHAHADRDPVRGLYTRLTQDGVDAWFDKAKLLPGQDWELEIRKAVREADVVVVCLSKQFNQAGFRQKEVRLALDTAMGKPEGEIFIIPARLEECDTLESLRKWHEVNLFEENGYEMLMRALQARADKIEIVLQVQTKLRDNLTVYYDRKPKLPSSGLDVEGGISGSAVVLGNNNVINMGVRAKGSLLRRTGEIKRENLRVSEERILEAAIEKQIIVGKSSSLFVWIRKQDSKSILSVIPAIDENVSLNENDVRAKGFEVEFPTEDEKKLSTGVILRLKSPEFTPPEQEKKLKIPPEGNSEVCTFIMTPIQAGDLRLNLEVLQDEVSLGNQTLITTAIETKKKVDTTKVLVTIPIVVFVQASMSTMDALSKNELIEVERKMAERYSREEAMHKLEMKHEDKEEAQRLSRQKAELEMMVQMAREKSKREAAERETKREAAIENKNQVSVTRKRADKAYSQKSIAPKEKKILLPNSSSLPNFRPRTDWGKGYTWIIFVIILIVVFISLLFILPIR